MTRLGDLCELRYGKSLPEGVRRSGPVSVYGSNGIVGTHDEAITDGRAIIVGRKGSVGAIHLSDSACWPIDTTYFIDRDATDVNLNWLGRALSTLRLPDLNKAAAVPGLTRSDVYDLKLFVPQAVEQRRIAAILDQADDLRRKRQAALAKANAIVRALFASMIGDVHRNERAWSRKCLSDVCEVRTGNTPSRQDSRYYGSHLEWIKSDNLDEDELFVTTASEQLSELGAEVGRTAPRGATLVTCIAGSPTSIGNAGFLDREVAFNQQINALIPKSINARFLFEHVRNAKSLIQEKSTGGMKGLVSKSRLESVEFMVPPIEVQTSFAQLVETALMMKSLQSEQLSKLDALFASLQHRAFRGEL